MIAMELEELSWCMSKLSPHQFVVYLVCRQLGNDCETEMQEIADVVGLSGDTVRHHMKQLQKLDFVRYDSSTGTGTVLLWVRLSPHDKAPNLAWLKRGRLSVRLKSPEGKIHTVKRGDFRAFCEKKGINRRCLYDLLEHKRKQYKGWTVA